LPPLIASERTRSVDKHARTPGELVRLASMDVLSQCRLRAGSVAWQTRAGAWALTVVCKATYRLTPIESPVAEDQEEIYEDDTHWNDDESRSLAVASDLAPFKARADVVVVGHAFAPQKQPVRAFSARLCVGEVDKAIEVWCDRGFAQSGQLLEGPRITKMSLRYERAAGGPETSNPAGMRFDAPPDAYGMVAIPNLQPPGRHIAWRGETFDPIGFGPIAPTWPTRRDKLYRYAAGWPYRRWSERPLPEDVDPGYFNVAPRDQQVEALRSNERIVLEGLHPDHPRLVTSLVGVRPRAFAERQGQGREEVALTCDTLWIDTDRALCTLTWRGRIGLRHREEAGRVVITEEGADAHGGMRAAVRGPALELSAAARALIASHGGSTDATSTLVPTPEEAASAARTPAMPFQAGGPQAGHAHGGAALPAPAGEPAASRRVVNAPKPVARVLSVASPSPGLQTETIPVFNVSATEPLPFQKENTIIGSWSDSRASAAPEVAHAPLASSVGALSSILPERDDASRMTAAPVTSGMNQPPDLPEPPPMIGPLARAGVDSAPFVEAPEPASPPTVPGPAPQAPPAVESKEPLADISLEKCAAITASIARRRADEAKILEVNELDRPSWEAAQARWLESIRRELERGKRELLRRFDAAYIEQLEKERGPIQITEYAQIVVASERGKAIDVLEGFALPAGSLMRIDRLWMERMGLDAELAQKVRESVDVARES
jgi:hypothetical protein